MTRCSIRLSHHGICAAALAALAVAIQGAANAQQKVLKVVPHADLKVLDFRQTTATITIMHAGLVYDQLFNWDEHMVGRPQMLDAYAVSPDQLRYIFTLPPGLTF